MRQYAHDRLLESGEASVVRGRHLGYLVRLAEASAPHRMGADEAGWLQRLEAEHDNLRAALEWSLAPGSGNAEPGPGSP